MITLFSTGIQIYIDYQRDISAIETKLNDIETSYINSLAVSLWNLDTKQLQVQLEGILKFADVTAVELVEFGDDLSRPLNIRLGDDSGGQYMKREFLITYPQAAGEFRTLGSLFVEVSLKDTFQRQIDRAIVILLSQSVKTFFVSLFILFIFFRLVTRHLICISDTIRKIDPRNPVFELDLDRHKNSDDELSEVVNALKTMSTSLKSAYEEISDKNEQLERDILARKAAEQEVIHLNNILEQRVLVRTSELEAANKELSAFSYSISHDLRAPIRRVLGFQRLLSESLGADLDDNVKHYLSRIEAGVDEMSWMVDSFLRLFRATSAQLLLEDVNLSALAQQINTQFREIEPDRRVELRVQDGMSVEADRRLFEVLLTNLFENAWKYSKNRELSKIAFGKKEEDGKEVYFIRDNGAGFDMKEADDLLKPFTRLHLSEDYEGNGIGLATVNRIVTRHGGDLWFDAEVDKGATFYFTLWQRKEQTS